MEQKEHWDAGMHAIAGLLREVEPLDDDSRIIRLQIASYQVSHYTFPESTFSLIETIGSGQADRNLVTGCGAHFGDLSDPQRHRRIRAYISTLESWADSQDLQEARDRSPGYSDDVDRIYGLLGERTRLKSLLAARLALLTDSMDREDFDHFFKRCCYPDAAELDRQILAEAGIAEETMEELISKGMALAEKDEIAEEDIGSFNAWSVYPVWGWTAADGEYPCHGNFFRHWDIKIASIGTGEIRGNIPETGENRERIASHMANIQCALDGWLAGLDPDESARAWTQAKETCIQVTEMLGSTTPLKRYLVATLWKKMRMHKGNANLWAKPSAFQPRWVESKT